jgi:hypothetical protein
MPHCSIRADCQSMRRAGPPQDDPRTRNARPHGDLTNQDPPRRRQPQSALFVVLNLAVSEDRSTGSGVVLMSATRFGAGPTVNAMPASSEPTPVARLSAQHRDKSIGRRDSRPHDLRVLSHLLADSGPRETAQRTRFARPRWRPRPDRPSDAARCVRFGPLHSLRHNIVRGR